MYVYILYILYPLSFILYPIYAISFIYILKDLAVHNGTAPWHPALAGASGRCHALCTD